MLSCNKDDSEPFSNNNNNNNKTGLLSQVFFGSELYSEYTYNETNQVLEEKNRFSYTKHNYQEGKLILSDYYIDSRIYSSSSYIVQSAMNRKEWVNSTNTKKNNSTAYFYDDNDRLIKSSIGLIICEYSYDERDRIIQQTFYSDNKKTWYLDFIYDENDNLIKRLHYSILDSGQAELQTTTEYEFDNKHNPYKALNSLMLPGRITNTNNITKEIYTDHSDVDQWTEKVQITKNVYEYNAIGFPAIKNEFETYKYYE